MNDTAKPYEPHPPSALRGVALIIRRELGQYYGTWSGYVIAAVLLCVSGLLFNVFAIGTGSRFSNEVLSDFFFFGSGTTIIAALLFSMRLIAEERQQGTLPLLATSPLTDGQIILAKYLSALLFLAFYIVLTVYMPALIFLNGKITLGHIFAGYVGLLSIGSATVAIGLFGSAAARSQLVAVIISAAIAVVMILLWMTGRVVEGTLGEIISYMALHDKHFRPFMDGVVPISSLVFYGSVTAVFLVLSRNVLEARRWRP